MRGQADLRGGGEGRLKCVYCGGGDTRVVDSRPQPRANFVRRRRECEQCGRRFSTTEMHGNFAQAPELFSPMVVKKSGAYQPLDRRKLARSIAVSLRKSRRDALNVDAVAEEVAEEILERETPADTRVIGEMILAKLKRLDPMGYLRYASVHREMASPRDFAKLLDELRDPVDAADNPAEDSMGNPTVTVNSANDSIGNAADDSIGNSPGVGAKGGSAKGGSAKGGGATNAEKRNERKRH